MSTQVSSPEAANAALNGTLPPAEARIGNGAEEEAKTKSEESEEASGSGEGGSKIWGGGSLFGSTAPPLSSPLHSPVHSSPGAQPTQPAVAAQPPPQDVEDVVEEEGESPPVDEAKEADAEDTDDSVLFNQPPIEETSTEDADEESSTALPMDQEEEEDAGESESPKEEEKIVDDEDEEPVDEPKAEDEPQEKDVKLEEKVDEAEEKEDLEIADEAESPEGDADESSPAPLEIPETDSKEMDDTEPVDEAMEETVDEPADEPMEKTAEDTDAAESKDTSEPDAATVESEEPAAGEEEEAAEDKDVDEAPATTPRKKLSRKEVARKAAQTRIAKAKAKKEAAAAETSTTDSPPADSPEQKDEEDEEDEAEAAEEEKTEDEPRGRRSTRLSRTPTTAGNKTPAKKQQKTSAAATPQSSRGGKRKHSETPVEEATEDATEEAAEEAEEVAEGKKTRGRRSSARARKPSNAAVEAAGEGESSGSNRSTPQPSKRPRRSGLKTPATEPPPASRRPALRRAAAQPTTPAAAAAKRRPATERKPKAAGKKKNQDDPFDFDAQADESPEPLKNISFDRSAHGSVTFSSNTPANKSAQSRFAFTEAVTSRKSGLSDTLPIEDFLSDGSVDDFTPARTSTLIRQRPSASIYRTTITKTIKYEKVDSFTGAVVKTFTPPAVRKRTSGGAVPKAWPKGTPPTSGSLGDVSSLGTKSSGSGPRPRSTPSSKSRTPSSKGSKGDFSLFNDIEDHIDEEEEAAPKPKTPKGTPKAATPTAASSRRSTTLEVAELSAEEQTAADEAGRTNVAQLRPGARILAKWPGDKCFYVAWVAESGGLGAFRVKFWDGAIRQAPFPDIVPLAALKEGQTLMKAIYQDGEISDVQPIDIISIPDVTKPAEWKAGKFLVFNQTTQENETVHWENMVIDKEQGGDFVANKTNKAAQEITSDNITSSRKRESRAKTVVVEATPPAAAKAKKASPRRAAPMPQPRLDESAEEAMETDDAGFFSGLKFVLTSANRRPKSDSDDDERAGIPAFNKKAVRTTIEERGGSVVDDFGPADDAEPVFLVADTHYRTHKYLSALARAVPAVSHTWILDSVAQNQLLDYKKYMLPAGVSLERNDTIEWHDSCPTLLSDWRVLVHTENRPSNPSALDFVQIWSPLVKCMGAELVPSTADCGTSLDLVLTDASCGEETLDTARKLGATAVSSEWLIQAIITGTPPAVDAHRKYHYGFVEHASPPAS